MLAFELVVGSVSVVRAQMMQHGEHTSLEELVVESVDTPKQHEALAGYYRGKAEHMRQIGGLKVIAESGWFAARPPGTEDIYKLYAESFRGPDHLGRILEEAQAIVDDALASAPQQSGTPSRTNGKEGP